MSIFSSIDENHIKQAIKEIDRNGLDGFTDSKYYDILYHDKRYPPKPVMALAEEMATGSKVSTTDFTGGEGTPAFNKLKELGFQIVAKATENGYAAQLHKFLERAKTGELKTKEFQRQYQGIQVKVSFGQGVAARIPWVSFLGENQSTSNGIYPVYLYYKNEDVLILAYGISETNKPDLHWNLQDPTSVKEFFKKEYDSKPDRYGESYIYEVYKVDKLPSDDVINEHLDNLIEYYKERLKMNDKSSLQQNSSKTFNYIEFVDSTKKSGLKYSELICLRFIASLSSKPFLILTGLSGSGKTKLAISFIQWICQDQSQYAIVPVGADWTNREPLLGFPNALNENEYVEPDSDVLSLIQRANENIDSPYFLLLDEMNLSHVERYFADFLSVMESGEPIYLHSMKECNIPEKIDIPDNLFIIGTVNIDETTYMFSPKVLDRANTIEFRINEDDLEKFLQDNKSINMTSLQRQGASMAASFVDMSRNKKIASSDEINTILVSFFTELKKAGAEFGYRSANEILILMGQLDRMNSNLTANEKLDIAVMQKLLPKLHGSRRKLEKILFALCRLCLVDDSDEAVVNQYLSNELKIETDDKAVKLPISLEKIQRMYQGAIEHGFASYAEA